MSDAHIERLLSELGERARADIAAVDAETDARIRQLRDEQAARFDADRAERVAACEREQERDQAAAVAAMKRDRRAALLGAQHAFVGRVLDRVRARLADCFSESSGHIGIVQRTEMLREFACSPDVEVTVSAAGISLIADGGHLRIHDTIDAWLAAERPRLAIEICRILESTTCPMQAS